MERRVGTRKKTIASAPSLLTFAVLVTVTALSGSYFEPGEWYRGLIKPPWTPSDRVFPPVWTVLYAAIAIAGWRVWRAAPRISLALLLWLMQLAFNAAWSWLFFGLHVPLLAFLDIVLLLLTVLGFILAAFRLSRIAAVLFVFYALWVAFAAALNYSLWKLNLGLI